MERKRILRLGRDALVIGAIFYGISSWQTRHHLGQEDQVPKFELSRLDDGTTQALPTAGGKSLVYFFAPWCGVCKVSAGNLATVRSWLGEGTDVVAVALDYTSVEEVRRFVDDHDVGVRVLLGTDAVRDAFRVDVYPTYYVLDSDGRVEHVSVGYSSLVGMLVRAVL